MKGKENGRLTLLEAVDAAKRGMVVTAPTGTDYVWRDNELRAAGIGDHAAWVCETLLTGWAVRQVVEKPVPAQEEVEEWPRLQEQGTVSFCRRNEDPGYFWYDCITPRFRGFLFNLPKGPEVGSQPLMWPLSGPEETRRIPVLASAVLMAKEKP